MGPKLETSLRSKLHSNALISTNWVAYWREMAWENVLRNWHMPDPASRGLRIHVSAHGRPQTEPTHAHRLAIEAHESGNTCSGTWWMAGFRHTAKMCSGPDICLVKTHHTTPSPHDSADWFSQPVEDSASQLCLIQTRFPQLGGFWKHAQVLLIAMSDSDKIQRWDPNWRRPWDPNSTQMHWDPNGAIYKS